MSGTSLRREAVRQLEAMREACRANGCAVMAALRHCALHRLRMPDWLAGAFITRHEKVAAAEVGSWDEAFDPPYPPRTRLAQVRLDRKRRAAVHAAMWAEVRTGAPINDILYDRIGELPEICASGTTVRRRYREAVEAGAMDLTAWREAQDCSFLEKVDP